MSIVRSNVDNQFYRVRNRNDKVLAADTLAKLNQKIKILLDYMQKKDPNNKAVQRLIHKFNPRSIHERPKDSKFTAYSINKGKDIYICVRHNNTGAINEDLNSLVYVILHELSHVMTVSEGHTKEFWKNYEFLLTMAVDSKIYTYEDYYKRYTTYCGIRLVGLQNNN